MQPPAGHPQALPLPPPSQPSPDPFSAAAQVFVASIWMRHMRSSMACNWGGVCPGGTAGKPPRQSVEEVVEKGVWEGRGWRGKEGGVSDAVWLCVWVHTPTERAKSGEGRGSGRGGRPAVVAAGGAVNSSSRGALVLVEGRTERSAPVRDLTQVRKATTVPTTRRIGPPNRRWTRVTTTRECSGEGGCGGTGGRVGGVGRGERTSCVGPLPPARTRERGCYSRESFRPLPPTLRSLRPARFAPVAAIRSEVLEWRLAAASVDSPTRRGRGHDVGSREREEARRGGLGRRATALSGRKAPTGDGV